MFLDSLTSSWGFAEHDWIEKNNKKTFIAVS